MSETEGKRSIDQQLFRRVMAQFATGVTIVTARDREGRNFGITANSFTSVSLDPPLALVCVARRIDFFRVISEAEHFNINLLAEQQQGLSSRFAMGGIDKFAGVNFRAGRNGVPVLPDTLGVLECARHEILPGGDHVIALGRVTHAETGEGQPLLYFGSQYRQLKQT
ncbi:MAG: flavin reductase family protein [Blastocatellia bacterium]